MTPAFDVGVVGGGVHGVAAAAALLRRGVSVVLVEREHPASGPTSRSSAVCRAYYTNPFLAEVARDGIAWFDAHRDEVGFRDPGCLFLHPPDDIDDVVRTMDSLRAIGTAVERVDPSMLPGARTDDVGIAVWEPRAGWADPASTTTALYDQAKRDGLASRLRTSVVDLDGTTLVTSAGERIGCGRVLLCAGPWTRPLAARAGADLPLTVERHYVVTAGWGPVAPLPFVFADLPNNCYAKPEGPALIGIGPIAAEPEVDADRFDEGVTLDEQVAMISSVATRVPAMEDLELRGGWASLYDVSPDWMPVIGEIGDGVFVDAGTSGHGFKLAPALGDHVAGLVLGDVHDDRIAAFHPRRFDTGQSIRGGFGDAAIIG